MAQVHIARQTLPDGNFVYDVLFSRDGTFVRLPAASEDDATKLAGKLRHAFIFHCHAEPVTLTANYTSGD